jgi:hypothetical protein
MLVRRARPLYPRAARATHQSVNRERCPSNELPDTLHVIHDGCSIQRRLVIPRPQKGVLHSPRQQRAVTIRVTACSHPRVSLRRGSPQRCQHAGVQLLQQPTMCFTTSSYPPAAARPRGNIPSWGEHLVWPTPTRSPTRRHGALTSSTRARSAPASRSTRTAGSDPHTAAWCNGVHPD